MPLTHFSRSLLATLIVLSQTLPLQAETRVDLELRYTGSEINSGIAIRFSEYEFSKYELETENINESFSRDGNLYQRTGTRVNRVATGVDAHSFSAYLTMTGDLGVEARLLTGTPDYLGYLGLGYDFGMEDYSMPLGIKGMAMTVDTDLANDFAFGLGLSTFYSIDGTSEKIEDNTSESKKGRLCVDQFDSGCYR